MGFGLKGLSDSFSTGASSSARKAKRRERQNAAMFRSDFATNTNQLAPHVASERTAINDLVALQRGDIGFNDLPGFESSLRDALDSVNREYAAGGKSLSGERLLALKEANLGTQDRAINRLLALSNPDSTNNQINLRLGLGQNLADSRRYKSGIDVSKAAGRANNIIGGLNTLVSGARVGAAL